MFLLLASESESSDAAEEPDEELPCADEEREDELEESTDEALDERALRRLVRERLLWCSFALDSESPLDSPALLLLPELELEELSEELLADRELLVSLELLPARPDRPLVALCCCLWWCLTPLGLPGDEDRLRLRL